MELRGILEQQAGYVRASGATVTVESRYPTVAIDGDGVDVFMQGDRDAAIQVRIVRLTRAVARRNGPRAVA